MKSAKAKREIQSARQESDDSDEIDLRRIENRKRRAESLVDALELFARAGRITDAGQRYIEELLAAYKRSSDGSWFNEPTKPDYLVRLDGV